MMMSAVSKLYPALSLVGLIAATSCATAPKSTPWLDVSAATEQSHNLTVCRFGQNYGVWDLYVSIDGQRVASLKPYQQIQLRIPDGERLIEFTWPALAFGSGSQISWKFNSEDGVLIDYQYVSTGITGTVAAPRSIMAASSTLTEYEVGGIAYSQCGGDGTLVGKE